MKVISPGLGIPLQGDGRCADCGLSRKTVGNQEAVVFVEGTFDGRFETVVDFIGSGKGTVGGHAHGDLAQQAVFLTVEQAFVACFGKGNRCSAEESRQRITEKHARFGEVAEAVVVGVGFVGIGLVHIHLIAIGKAIAIRVARTIRSQGIGRFGFQDVALPLGKGGHAPCEIRLKLQAIEISHIRGLTLAPIRVGEIVANGSWRRDGRIEKSAG